MEFEVFEFNSFFNKTFLRNRIKIPILSNSLEFYKPNMTYVF